MPLTLKLFFRFLLLSAQGTDSLEVVHREPTPGHGLPHPAAAGNASLSSPAKRGGIHAFGQCYIPYTSRANKEVGRRQHTHARWTLPLLE